MALSNNDIAIAKLQLQAFIAALPVPPSGTAACTTECAGLLVFNAQYLLDQLPDEPDLIITGLSASTNQVEVGTTLTVTTVVRNQGGGTASSTMVRLLLSSDTTIGLTDDPLADIPLSALEMGQIQTLHSAVAISTSLHPGAYTLGACVIAHTTIVERIETNNCKSGRTLTVTTPVPEPLPSPPPNTIEITTFPFSKGIDVDNEAVEGLSYRTESCRDLFLTENFRSPTGTGLVLYRVTAPEKGVILAKVDGTTDYYTVLSAWSANLRVERACMGNNVAMYIHAKIAVPVEKGETIFLKVDNPDPAVQINGMGLNEIIVDFVESKTMVENTSPVSALPQMMTCPRERECSFVVPAADANGDPIRFRLSTALEASGNESGFMQPGPPYAPYAATIDPESGLYRWDTRGAMFSSSDPLNPVHTLYSTQVIIEELDWSTGAVKGYVATDFLIRLVDVDPVDSPPVFDLPFSSGLPPSVSDAANNNVTVTTPPNRPVHVVIDVRDDHNNSDNNSGNDRNNGSCGLFGSGCSGVKVKVINLPSDGKIGEELVEGSDGSSSRHFYFMRVDLSWTPTPADTGTQVITFVATDSAGQQTVFPITIHVTTVYLSLTPESATSSIGTPHTITALLSNENQPVPDTIVNFKIFAGPHAGLSQNVKTDSNGEARFTYVGQALGTDQIGVTATVMPNGNGLTQVVTAPRVAQTWVVIESCDGVDNNQDGNIDEGFLDTDNDGLADCVDPDDDGDSVTDVVDNCLLIANPDQFDTDQDGMGNTCDTDDDNDGVEDTIDNCPLTANPDQTDTDADGMGNTCDTDDDNDGVADDKDECPLLSTPNVIVGTASNNVLRGTLGNDLMRGLAGNDTIHGMGGNDCLVGGSGNDRIYGGDGDDIAKGEDGRDTLQGGVGNDTLDGGIGNDALDGGVGNDILDGAVGNDRLKGDTGNDTLNGGMGNDVLDGGVGNDAMDGGPGIDKCFGGAGTDTAANCEKVTGIP